MKSAYLLLFLLVVLGSTNAETIQNCIAVHVNLTVFNLCAFAQNPPYQIISNFTTDVVHLALGNNHLRNCDDSTDIWAKVTRDSTDPAALTCENVATEGPDYSLINSANPSEGLVMTFPRQNHTNGTTGKDYQVKVNLICNEGATDTKSTVFSRSQDLELDELVTIELIASSDYGCPVVSFNEAYDFLAASEDVLAGVLGVLGLIICFFGHSLLKLTIFLVSSLVTALVIITICFEFLNLTAEEWMIWVVIGSSIVVGILVGVLAVKYKKVGYGILGGACGDIAAIMLYDAIIEPVVTSDVATYIFYGLLMVAGIVGTNLALFMIKPMIIICSSVIGAFSAVRSASFFIGGYPLETFVLKGVKSFDWVTYVYLLAIVGIAIWGMYFQFDNKKKKKDLKEKKRENERMLKDINDMRC